MKTRQEVFDTVVNHLLTQMEKSQLNDTCCAYRSPYDKNLKCAIGCLIPDSEYNEEIEQSLVHEIIDNFQFSYETNEILHNNLEMLGALQAFHDNFEPTSWYVKLKEVAEFLGLNTTIFHKFNEQSNSIS